MGDVFGLFTGDSSPVPLVGVNVTGDILGRGLEYVAWYFRRSPDRKTVSPLTRLLKTSVRQLILAAKLLFVALLGYVLYLLVMALAGFNYEVIWANLSDWPKTPDRWCDLLVERMGPKSSHELLKCPEAPDQRCAYAFNRHLASVAMIQLSRPSESVLLFESAAGWNAVGVAEDVLKQPRHAGLVGVAFCDGHAEMVPPNRINQLVWDPMERWD